MTSSLFCVCNLRLDLELDILKPLRCFFFTLQLIFKRKLETSHFKMQRNRQGVFQGSVYSVCHLHLPRLRTHATPLLLAPLGKTSTPTMHFTSTRAVGHARRQLAQHREAGGDQKENKSK